MAEYLELEQVLNADFCALLVWDMQVGIAGQAMGLSSIASASQALIDTARELRVPVIWTQHVSPPPDQVLGPALRSLVERQGVHSLSEAKLFMPAGTADIAFLSGFEPWEDELVIEKSTPSLFIGTQAELRLRALGIRTLVMSGVATELGILFTARHAASIGFFPVVAAEAVGSFSDEGHQVGLQLLSRACDVVSTQTVLALWRDSADA